MILGLVLGAGCWMLGAAVAEQHALPCVAPSTKHPAPGTRYAAKTDADYITPSNYTQFCRSNEALVKGAPRGILLEFPGLSGNSCLGGQMAPLGPLETPFAKMSAAAGFIHLYMLTGPWNWMKPGAVRVTDLVVTAVRAKFGLANDAPLIVSGGSMGGLGALVYGATSRHAITGCIAACPCYDVPALYNCRADFPCTFLSAACEDAAGFEAGLRAISPAHHLAAFPNVPYLVIGDEKDDLFPIAGLDAFVDKMRARGLAVEYLKLPGEPHGGMTPQAWARIGEMVRRMGKVPAAR